MHSPVLEFEPGQWYFVVTCKNCKARKPMIHDLTRGRSIITAVYNWRCPMCQHEASYESEEIERYEHET